MKRNWSSSNCINKFSKLSKKYLDVIRILKSTVFSKEFSSSVNYNQIRELENIRDRFEGSNEEPVRPDILQLIKIAVNEIENFMLRNSDSCELSDIIDFIKKQFHSVFMGSKAEADNMGENYARKDSSAYKFNKIKDFDNIKGRLDFQNAMDDFTKTYESLKEKSFKSLNNLEERYDQISRDLTELNQRISSYDIPDVPSIKVKSVYTNVAKLKDKDIMNILNDVIGHVKYTDESVRAAASNCFMDITCIKDALIGYNELVENKLRTANMLSRSNLKQKANRDGANLYELYLEDQNKSERSHSAKEDSNVEAELKRDLKKFSAQASKWRKEHKQLYDAVQENFKLYKKLTKSGNLGKDSIQLYKDMYK